MLDMGHAALLLGRTYVNDCCCCYTAPCTNATEEVSVVAKAKA